MKNNVILFITSIMSTIVAIICYKEVVKAREYHNKLYSKLTNARCENITLKNELEALKEEL